MLIKDLKHAKLVKARIETRWKKTGRRYIVWDSETKGKTRYHSDIDALIIGRADATFLSMCYMGEVYSFPTSFFSPRFPDPEEWGKFLEDWFTDPTVIKVMHNANYDLNIANYSLEEPYLPNIWCTMIGGWKASEYKESGLKERAPQYGRYWRETKTVDFTKLNEVADYAEQDVIQTDEMFQMQFYGEVDRKSEVKHVSETGELVSIPCELPSGKFVIKSETLRSFDKSWLRLVELPVLRATIRAERRGFPFNVFELYKIRRRLNADLRHSLKTMYRMAGKVFNLNSGPQKTAVAEELGIENPYRTKPSEKHPNGQACWDSQALSKLKGTHPFIDALVKYNSLDKLCSVYVGTKPLDIRAYPEQNESGLEYYVNTTTGCIHASAGTVNAVTGRGSSSNPNLQQIPSKKDIYGIRHCFTSTPRSPYQIYSPRYTKAKNLIVLDYAQLEIRIMALLCKDKNMTKILRDPSGDIHQNTSDEFGVTRDAAKQLNFLLLYGGGYYMLSEKLTYEGIPTSKTVAQEYIETHKKVYPRVPEYRLELVATHAEKGFVTLFLGRRRSLRNNKDQDDIDYSNERSVHKAETQLSNNVVQGSGQDFLKASIIRADPLCINPDKAILDMMPIQGEHKLYLKDKARKLEKHRRILKQGGCKFILQVHDEAIFTADPSASEECMHIVADIMSWKHYFPAISDYNVPLVAEGGVGNTWKEAKSKDGFLFHCKSGFEEWKNYAK